MLDDIKGLFEAPAAGGFTFSTGAKASTVQELIKQILKPENWDASEDHLYKGHFSSWLGAIGRGDLATRAEDARSAFPRDKTSGLWTFLWHAGYTSFDLFPKTKVNTLKQLVGASDRNWDEAKEYLYSGLIEQWLDARGFVDKARKASEVRERERDENIGLEEFLEECGATPPKLEVTPSSLDFGSIEEASQRITPLLR